MFALNIGSCKLSFSDEFRGWLEGRHSLLQHQNAPRPQKFSGVLFINHITEKNSPFSRTP